MEITLKSKSAKYIGNGNTVRGLDEGVLIYSSDGTVTKRVRNVYTNSSSFYSACYGLVRLCKIILGNGLGIKLRIEHSK